MVHQLISEFELVDHPSTSDVKKMQYEIFFLFANSQ